MWAKIPKEIMDELEDLRKFTRSSGNEGSLTFCKRKNKERLYIGADFEGNNYGTIIGDCAEELGKEGTRIGDMHSHPIAYDSPGITPSYQDIHTNIANAKDNNKPQIGCITSPGADLIHCMEAKEIPSTKKVKAYENPGDTHGVFSGYILDHFKDDFNVALFDTKSGEKVDNPEPKRVIDNTVGKARKVLKQDFRKQDYGHFCEYIQDVTVPHDDRIYDLCKSELRKKGLLDYLGFS